jgi:hypothetical protein
MYFMVVLLVEGSPAVAIGRTGGDEIDRPAQKVSAAAARRSEIVVCVEGSVHTMVGDPHRADGLFVRLRFVDPTLMRINILLLMVAAFLPFPTTVLAAALDTSRSAERTAVILYGATAAAIELLLAAAWRHAAAERELGESDEGDALAPARRGRGGPSALLYAVACGIGLLVFPRLAAVGYLLVAVRGVFMSGAEGRLTLGGLRGRSDG